jgi:hypothetical protein
MLRSLTITVEFSYVKGHLGSSSSHVDFSSIHPKPGKKSVRYKRSVKKNEEKQNVSMTAMTYEAMQEATKTY